MLNVLKNLCAIPSPPGREGKIAEYIMREIGDFSECRVDKMGNIIAFKKGEQRAETKLMLAAHMDEVGFIITNITDEGYLKFSLLGGILPGVMVGRRVKIGDIYGVIGIKPTHLCEPDERKNIPKADDLYIDIGGKDKENAEEYVSLGSTAVFDSDLVFFGGDFIKAPALDDKIGCAVLIDIIKNHSLKYDTYFVFTTGEEIGSRGAKVAAYTLSPQAAVVLEATTAADIMDIPKENRVCALKQGAVLSFMDGKTVYDKELYQLHSRLAAENGIMVQPKAAVSGGNDAGEIHLSRGGVKTAAVSLPCRYLHSACCVISISDIKHTKKLLLQSAEHIAGRIL